jgi:hypothetical protein
MSGRHGAGASDDDDAGGVVACTVDLNVPHAESSNASQATIAVTHVALVIERWTFCSRAHLNCSRASRSISSTFAMFIRDPCTVCSAARTTASSLSRSRSISCGGRRDSGESRRSTFSRIPRTVAFLPPNCRTRASTIRGPSALARAAFLFCVGHDISRYPVRYLRRSWGNKRGLAWWANPLVFLIGPRGIEPRTPTVSR